MEILQFGLVADVHYADKERWRNRYYRKSLKKLKLCMEIMNREKIGLLIHLGDLVDAGENVKQEFSYLKSILSVYKTFQGESHTVIGNHDTARLSKEEFLTGCGLPKGSPVYYSFDRGAFHIVILDACFNEDYTDYNRGNFTWTEAYISPAELKWLEADLKKTSKPTIIMVHQRLDGKGDHFVGNTEDVCDILNRSGKVTAVFQGHDHAGDFRVIDDIPYITLKAMVESPEEKNCVSAIVTAGTDGSLRVQGLGVQSNHTYGV